MKHKFLLITLLILNFFPSCSQERNNTEKALTASPLLTVKIPMAGNSWVMGDLENNTSIITADGIQNWTDTSTVIRTYFKTDTPGKVHLALHLKAMSPDTELEVSLGGQHKVVQINNPEFKIVEVGVFQIDAPGYHFIELRGVHGTGSAFAEIKEILLGGDATKGQVHFVRDDFYWGRRGPSVHLNYTTPAHKQIEWFYNEITVPQGQDVLGSYYMANGFGEGYFGIQVNSSTERRVLFSVWSPYETQDPSLIPEDQKIILLSKGKGVITGEFGNEGSGGQSYKVVNWVAGNTYRFMVKVNPSIKGSTDYAAYFYAPEAGHWQLVARFRRPHTQTYINRPHSFLENFMTSTGYLGRYAHYTNQWVRDTAGSWHELLEAKFTADATARKEFRVDYDGGITDRGFYLKNCGFFNGTAEIDSHFKRNPQNMPPQVDLDILENMTE